MQYEGDVEQSSIKRGGQALRATVDGDAKRTRRHSSDESAGGGSVRELDASRYLDSYQKSTPMQPGMCIILCDQQECMCKLRIYQFIIKAILPPP